VSDELHEVYLKLPDAAGMLGASLLAAVLTRAELDKIVPPSQEPTQTAEEVQP